MSNKTQVQPEIGVRNETALRDAYYEFFQAYRNFKFALNGAIRVIENEGPGFMTKNGLDGPEMVGALQSSFNALDKTKNGLADQI